jgi:hypothetical protein
MTRLTPLWIQAGDYAAQTDRQLLTALWPTDQMNGFLPSPGASPLTVNIGIGRAAVVLSGGTVTLCATTAVETVTCPSAHATLPRVDRVVCTVRDDGTNNDFIFQVVQGTAAASPVAPAEPTNSATVATVLVPAAHAGVFPAGNVTDARPRRLDQPWNCAWGEQAYATLTAAQTGLGSTLTDVPNLSLTWDSPGNRTYLVTACIPQVQQLTANGQMLFQLADAANAITTNQWIAATFAVPNAYNAFVQGRVTSAAKATLTRKLRASTSAGTMNLTVGAGVPGWMRVDDIGPMTGTAGTLRDTLTDRMEGQN